MVSKEIVDALRQKLTKEFGEQVHLSLRNLFERKHLYQSERIEVPGFESAYPLLINPSSKDSSPKGVMMPVGSSYQYKTLSEDQMKQLQWLWPKVQNIGLTFELQKTPSQPLCVVIDDNKLSVALPIVSRHCPVCENISPHHPGFFGADTCGAGTSIRPVPGKPSIEVFLFPYQCQQCRKEPLVFSVRRDGVKFQLTGRSLFVMDPIPSFVPKPVRNFYSESLVASSAGKPLAGCLYLRLVVEHHMRTFVKMPEKSSGEDLSDAYARVLHPEFPRSRASLRVVYSDLSEVIHTGREDAVVFERCLYTIHEHFRTLEILPVPVQDTISAQTASEILHATSSTPSQKLSEKKRKN